MKTHKPGFFGKLLRFSFLLAGLSGFLRLYGAIRQQPDILTFSQKAWLPTYLMLAGGLMGVVNIAIWFVLKRKFTSAVWLPWAGILMNILAYWAERFLLWAPTQRGTNVLWVIAVHVAWLLLAGLSQHQMKRRKYEHE